MWSSRSRSRSTALLIATALLAACDEGHCARRSDCAAGLECRFGACAVPARDADAEPARPDAATDGESDAAVVAPDAAPGELDAAPEEIDAAADAALPQEQEVDGGGPSALDASIDASL